MADKENANEINYIKEKKSLLKKYDIPINHLTFEYVAECTDGKELEQITKILRSGEEGYYPQLLECCEKKLTHVLPNSKVLRVEEPILTKECLSKDQWNSMTDDMQKWSNVMKYRELELQEDKPMHPPILPAVRNPDPVMKKSNLTLSPLQNAPKKVKCVVPRDYSKWDKFDADSEILRLDLEEEQEREEAAKRLREKEMTEKKKIHIIEKEGQNVISETVHGGRKTPRELQFLAEAERMKGNDCYHEGDFAQAKRHYSASISIYPTVTALNNRGMTNMKLNMYGAALADCNQVLAREPDNTKALLRRGTAHRNTFNMEQAKADFSRVLELEPGNRFACETLSAVQKDLDRNKPKIKTMPLRGKDHKGVKIVEINADNGEPSVQTPVKVKRAVNIANKHVLRSPERGSGEGLWGTQRMNIPKVAAPEKIPVESLTKTWETKGVKIEEITNADTIPEIPAMRLGKTVNPDVQQVAGANSLPVGMDLPIHVKAELVGVPDELEFPGGENGRGDMDCSKETVEVLPVYHPGKVDQPMDIKADALLPDELDSVDNGIGRGDEEGPRNIIPTQEMIPGTFLEEKEQPIPMETEPFMMDFNQGEKVWSPFEFARTWQALKDHDDGSLRGRLLSSIPPKKLSSVIGNKLDGPMLIDLLQCLDQHFDNHQLLLDFLVNIIYLERFSIINMFLSPVERQAVGKLFVKLEEGGVAVPGALKKAFSI